MPFWLILGIALWLGSIVVAIALFKAAARADKQLGYTESDPYLIEERAARIELARRRAGFQDVIRDFQDEVDADLWR